MYGWHFTQPWLDGAGLACRRIGLFLTLCCERQKSRTLIKRQVPGTGTSINNYHLLGITSDPPTRNKLLRQCIARSFFLRTRILLNVKMQASMQLRSAAASKVAGKNAGAIAPVVPVQRVNRYDLAESYEKSLLAGIWARSGWLLQAYGMPAPGLASGDSANRSTSRHLHVLRS
jgi:hypothetical protein